MTLNRNSIIRSAFAVSIGAVLFLSVLYVPWADAASVSDGIVSNGELNLVELDGDSQFVREGDYVLSAMCADIISHRSKADGWFRYYSEGTENGVPWKEWPNGDGMYTNIAVFFDMQNLSQNQSVPFTERLNGLIVYNLDLNSVPDCKSATEYLSAIRELVSVNSEAEYYEFTPLQDNPGQTDMDGFPAISVDAVLLKNNETACQRLYTGVTETFLNSWEDSFDAEPMWAVFSYEKDLVYLVNLRELLRDMDEE